MSDHNAIDTRVATRPVWRTFLLLFITSGLYRTYWAWRTNTDLAAFARQRDGVLPAGSAVRANAGTNAFLTFLLLPGATALLWGMLLSLATTPSEYGASAPTDSDLAILLGFGGTCLLLGLIAQVRTERRIRAARTLAGLEPMTTGTGRGFTPVLALDLIAVPASMFAMQNSLNDLWARFPPLLDEDLHGEIAPEHARDAAIARRPELHEQRLRRVADELEQPDVVPWVTIAFATLCVAVFAFQLWSHGPFPDTADIERVGGLQSNLDGQWWRFWVSNVLHGGVEHLTGNLLAWAFVATMVERAVGHARTAALVVVGAAGSSLGVLVADLDEPSIGASGVVFAAFAMAALLDPLARRSIGKLGWSLVVLGLGLSTFAPGISSAGHVGGVLAGFLLGGIVTLVWRVRRPMRTAADRAARRRPPVDRSAPLAPDRELTIAERLAHLDRRRDIGAIDPGDHERLRHALVTRG